MRALLAVVAVLVATLAVPLPVHAETDCEPYPIGRCGAYDRERVIFCYEIVRGLMVSTTVEAVTLALDLAPVREAAGLPALPVEDRTEVLHVRTAPTEDFVADVMNAPLPFESVYQETNHVAGLQMKRSTCAYFEWWAECDSWMGPYGEFTADGDAQIV